MRQLSDSIWVMFEVHPDDKNLWILYETGDGGFDLIAWFADKDDAEFAMKEFAARTAERKQPAPTDDVRPDHVTTELA